MDYKAVDTDDGGASRSRMATEDTAVLFVAGCVENQVKLHAP